MTALDHALLTLDEEQMLLSKAATGDRDAFTSLVEHNQRLISSIANQYYSYYGGNVPYDDIMQMGNQGLIKAIHKYDPGKKVKLATHATWWIRASIHRGCSRANATVAVSDYANENLTRARRARAELYQVLGREPTIKELAGVTGLSRKNLSALFAAANTASFEGLEPCGAAPPAPDNVEELVEKRLLMAAAINALRQLDKDTQEIIRRRLGYPDGKVETIPVIAASMGMTFTQANRRYHRGIELIKNYLS